MSIKWFMVSTVVIPPPRRTAATEAPTLWQKKPGIGCDNHATALQKGFHLGRNVSGIDRGAEYYAISLDHTAEYLRKIVFGKHAVATAFAGETSRHGGIS